MDIKNLVESIISDIADSKIKMGDLLRKTRILAFKLQNDNLKSWLDCEVNGYSDEVELPDYRKLSAVLFGQITQNRGFAGIAQHAHFRLPVDHLDNKIRTLVQSWNCFNPIAEIQNIIDARSNEGCVHVTCNTKVIPLIQQGLESNVNINQIWLEVQIYDLVNIIESVKNQLLEMMLNVDSELDLGADFNIPQNRQRVNKVVNNITAGVANFGNNSQLEISNNTITANSGQIESPAILSKLDDIIVSIDKINTNNEVTEILSEIKAEMSSTKNPKKLKMLFNAIIGVATEVAGNLITPYAQEAVSFLNSISLPM